MKKTLRAVLALACAGALLFGLAACGTSSERNPYEVATELGYQGSEGAWLAGQTGGGTEARRMYDEARAAGYTGTYIDFLKEIGYPGDDTPGINRALNSVVEIAAVFHYPFSAGGENAVGESYTGGGSGVIYELDRSAGNAYVITNYHVVYNSASSGLETVRHISDEISLYLYGDTLRTSPVEATFVGGVMEEDIAVLRVENSDVLKNSSAMACEAANSDAVTVGERVYVIGSPNRNGISAVTGIVSVDAEYISIILADGVTVSSTLEIRTDAPINHGNSGGGLFNADGRLIGISNARRETSGIEHFGYALPSNIVLAVAQNIIDSSKVNPYHHGALRAMLGVTLTRSEAHSTYDEKSAKTYISERVTVKEVNGGGAASGKLQAGDLIYSIRIGDGADIAIRRMHMVDAIMYSVRKGNTVTITVDRGGEIVPVEIPFVKDSDFSLYS